MRPIDVDKLTEEYKRLLQRFEEMGDDGAVTAVELCRHKAECVAPTIDAVPVRHAFWYWDKDGMDWNIGAWRCSACHNRPNTIWETEKNPRPQMWSGSTYCSNCGAKMDGEKND